MPTWMIVEDAPEIFDVLAAMFEIWGIDGVSFIDGSEAVSWIDDVDSNSVTDDLPELALLDIRLPTLSGPEVGARLRRSKRLGNVGIVLMTAYRLSPAEERQVIQMAQADALIYKPLPTMNEFRTKLESVIAQRKKRVKRKE